MLTNYKWPLEFFALAVIAGLVVSSDIFTHVSDVIKWISIICFSLFFCDPCFAQKEKDPN